MNETNSKQKAQRSEIIHMFLLIIMIEFIVIIKLFYLIICGVLLKYTKKKKFINFNIISSKIKQNLFCYF